MSENKPPTSERLPKITVESAMTITQVYLGLAAGGDRDGWEEYMQNRNFMFALDIVRRLGGRPEDYSLLDVGCGSGKLAIEWAKLGGTQYTGIDLLEPDNEAFKALCASHPGFSFVHGEFTRADIELFDIVIASGSLSIGAPRDKYAHFKAYLERMMVMARQGIYVNYWEHSDEVDGFTGFLGYESDRIDKIVQRMMKKRGFQTYDRGSDTYKGQKVDQVQHHMYIQRGSALV